MAVIEGHSYSGYRLTEDDSILQSDQLTSNVIQRKQVRNRRSCSEVHP